MISAIFDSLNRALGPDWRTKRFVLAVSGGADSMVLGTVLCDLLPAGHTIVAHMNHGLRGAQSDADEALVKRVFEDRGIVVECRRLQSGTSEEILRDARRTFLEEIRKKHGFDFIVTAHHAEDQLETLLMRLIRGTGVDGLASMSAVSGLYVKPFLNLSKDTLCEFARISGIEFREDASNRSDIYFRNRLRHSVLPSLYTASESHGGKEALLEKVARLTEDLSEHTVFFDDLSAKWRAEFVVRSAFWDRFSLTQWNQLKAPLSDWILRDLIRELTGLSPSRVTLNRLKAMLKGSARAIHLEGDVRVRQSCGWVFLQTAKAHALSQTDLKFERLAQGFECVPIGMRFSVVNETFQNAEMRFFQPGDHFRHTKLKKLLLTHRIPSPERAFVPVLALPKSNELLWYFPLSSEGVRAERLDFPFSVIR